MAGQALGGEREEGVLLQWSPLRFLMAHKRFAHLEEAVWDAVIASAEGRGMSNLQLRVCSVLDGRECHIVIDRWHEAHHNRAWGGSVSRYLHTSFLDVSSFCWTEY